MKTGFKSIFLLLIVLICLNDLNASGIKPFIPDTANLTRTSNHPDSIKKNITLYIDIATGLLINNTIGIHPIIYVSLGLGKNKNRFDIAYEFRFGNSDKYYQILDNDTLKSTNSYKANYFGFEYRRQVFRNANHKLYTNAGIGFDWILINKNETIKNNKEISGLALNIGIGYGFFIKKKHGPNIELLYHYADFNNKGTKIDKNSILIRLSYNFQNNYF